MSADGQNVDGETVESVPVPPARTSTRRRWRRWQAALLGLIALSLAALGVALWWIDTDHGHRFLASRISAMQPASGLRVRVGRIDGSIYKNLVVHDLTLGDPQGTVASIPVAYLGWYPFAWFSNRLDIDRLHVPRMALARMPKLRPSGEKKPILPGFDMRIADLRIDRIDLGKAITGQPRTALLKGRVDVRAGRAVVALDARSLDEGDAIRLALDSRPDANRFGLELLVLAPKGGVLVAMSGIGRPFVGRVTGKGDWSLWNGQALLSIDGAPLSRITIVQREGRYALNGTVEAAALGGGALDGRAQGGGLVGRLAAPRIRIEAQGAMANRIVEGRLSLRSSALGVTATGGIDLGRSSFDNLLLDISVPRANVLMKNASSEKLVARARLRGAFASASYEYLLTARRLTLGKARIEGLRSAGKGRLALADTTVIPLDLHADRVALNSPVIDDVLHNVSIRGLAQLKAGVLTSQPVAIRSNKIDGRVILLADFGRGNYSAAFTGDVKGIEIKGFGRVDLNSRVDAVNRAGTGFSVKGRARAIMRRFDNGFLHGLGGGLPQATSDLTLERDGRVRFSNFVLTAPLLHLAADGYRATDGTFHFTGSGRHNSYGPLRLSLDGKIERPQVDLTLASPLPALGLSDVHALLVP
ncbi:MAG TPA: translocation/assembly module TamB, partial [Sphingobium sp.]